MEAENSKNSSNLMKKTKQEINKEEYADLEDSIVMPIASPLANSVTSKRILKEILKTENLVSGIKKSIKKIKNTENCIVVINANVLPVDLVIHIPSLCEDRNIPYIFASKKFCANKTVVVLEGENERYEKIKRECFLIKDE
ncbi:hypothetical protein NUSPORA_01393 [Nucleospora cyclopteri]